MKKPTQLQSKQMLDRLMALAKILKSTANQSKTQKKDYKPHEAQKEK
jgi:hypothetical protein